MFLSLKKNDKFVLSKYDYKEKKKNNETTVAKNKDIGNDDTNIRAYLLKHIFILYSKLKMEK